MENGLESDQMVACHLVHMIGCALSNREPEVFPDGLSWEDVVSRARNNSVLGLIWHAARWLDGIPGGVRESCRRFSEMVVLHNVRYDAERADVCAALRAEGLSVLPLKGANLVSRYPDYSMCEVGDNDLLFGLVGLNGDGACVSRVDSEEDAARLRERALRVMEGLGYTPVPDAEECHLHLVKDSGLSFELHDRLFSDRWSFAGYYRDLWRLVRPVDESSIGGGAGMELALPLEDEYVYLMAHACKHARYKGVGLRALADVIVMNQSFGDSLDRDYIREQFLEMGILDFAEPLERLARAVYDGTPLSDEQLDTVTHMMLCGTYGTEAEGVRIRLRRSAGEGRRPCLAELRRFFSFETVKSDANYSAFNRYRWLRPFFPVYKLLIFIYRFHQDSRAQLSKLAAFFGDVNMK